MASVFVNGPRPVLSFETLTVSTTAVNPTATAIKSVTVSNSSTGNPDVITQQAVEAFCTVEGNSVRFRIDGTAATSTVGHALNVGDSITVQGAMAIKNLSLIRSSTTDGTVSITYYK